MCGGTRYRSGHPGRPAGLSPRVRGNPPEISVRSHAAGSIPACAGEPSATYSRSLVSSVYPRVCGGTPIAFPRWGPASGLSPRVRGNRAARHATRKGAGSIPACAGEPAVGPRRIGLHGVYPRVCGGTGVRRGSPRRRPGLSPRVRGNQSGSPPRDDPHGSIPACAGEPPDGVRGSPRTGVYPRVCGGTPPTPHRPA